MNSRSLLYSTTIRPRNQVLGLHEAYDLLLLVELTILAVLLQQHNMPLLRVPLGLGVTFFGPGYALMSVIFPRHADLDGFARATLSFVMSIAQMPLLILALDKTVWGFQPRIIVYALAIWIVLLCGLSALQRNKLLLAGSALLPHVPRPHMWWHKLGSLNRLYLLLTVLVMSTIIAASIYTITVQLTKPLPNEFYILGSEGQAQDYPRTSKVGQVISVTMGITNYADFPSNYRLEVWIVDPWNTTHREPVLTEEAIMTRPHEHLQRPISWTMTQVGDNQQIELLLFRADETLPYRTLELWLDITE